MTLMNDAVGTLRQYRSDPIVVDRLGQPLNEDNYASMLATLVVEQVGLYPRYVRLIATDLIQRARVRTATVIPRRERVMECAHPECDTLATLHGDQGPVCDDHLAWVHD